MDSQFAQHDKTAEANHTLSVVELEAGMGGVVKGNASAQVSTESFQQETSQTHYSLSTVLLPSSSHVQQLPHLSQGEALIKVIHYQERRIWYVCCHITSRAPAVSGDVDMCGPLNQLC